MDTPSFSKGDPVTIAPPNYPMQRWLGQIVRKTPRGYSVEYEAFGLHSRDVFPVSALSPRAEAA